jgi:hypothetical protein
MQLFRSRAGQTSAISDHVNDVIAGPFKLSEAEKDWPNAPASPATEEWRRDHLNGGSPALSGGLRGKTCQVDLPVCEVDML